MSFKLAVVSTPEQKLAYSNRVYVSPQTFSQLASAAAEKGIRVSSTDMTLNVWVGTIALQASANNAVGNDQIALNGKQRKFGQFMLNQTVEVKLHELNASSAVESFEFGVDLLVKKEGGPNVSIDCDELMKSFKTQFINQLFVVAQDLAVDFDGVKLDVSVTKVNYVDMGEGKHVHGAPGHLTQSTNLIFRKAAGSKSPIIFTGTSSGPTRNDNLFKADFNFEKMGIGGLNNQFQTIFRRAFASRVYPGIMKEMGMNPVRGMLLFGPPGCGKTLIARQIGKILNAHEPKIVNGPEILDKYVGGSEEKIRELFADAEKEQAELGDNSNLHIIIFDEMDAVMKKRGSTNDNTGVHDSIVNQLLSKIDGVDSLNNILIIGMTNRKDLIDEAIMRPGRLEVQIEIGLPSFEGRLQILNIHTSKMKKHGRITPDALARLPEIAEAAKNYTGAELEGLVRAASSYAFRNVDITNLKNFDEKSVIVTFEDFKKALEEIVPAFGNKDGAEIEVYCRNGILLWGDRFTECWETCKKLMDQAKTSKWAHLMSLLLWGEAGAGKTAIAAKLCIDSQYPFVRMITADSMIGMSEQQKCAHIYKTFVDSYKSPLSIIFIDDLERIIEFSPVGPRFSNSVLQTLLVLLRKVPPNEESRLLTIVTTSAHSSLEMLVSNLDECFTLSLNVPTLETDNEVAAFLREASEGLVSAQDAIEVASVSHKPIGVKRLLTAMELARQADDDSGTVHVSKEELIYSLHKI